MFYIQSWIDQKWQLKIRRAQFKAQGIWIKLIASTITPDLYATNPITN